MRYINGIPLMLWDNEALGICQENQHEDPAFPLHRFMPLLANPGMKVINF